MAGETLKKQYERWIAMWNGNYDLLDELILPDCIIHQAPSSLKTAPLLRGAAGIRHMIQMGHAPFTNLRFRVEVPPIVEGDWLSARWSSVGVYRGGIPGTAAESGTSVTFGGIDIMRFENNMIAEYWVSSDGLYLMAQLGVGTNS